VVVNTACEMLHCIATSASITQYMNHTSGMKQHRINALQSSSSRAIYHTHIDEQHVCHAQIHFWITF